MRIHQPLTFALLAAACLPTAEDGADPATPRDDEAGVDETGASDQRSLPVPTVDWSTERDGDHLLVHCDVEFEGEAPRFLHFDGIAMGPASAERFSLDRPDYASRLGPRREWRSSTPEAR